MRAYHVSHMDVAFKNQGRLSKNLSKGKCFLLEKYRHAYLRFFVKKLPIYSRQYWKNVFIQWPLPVWSKSTIYTGGWEGQERDNILVRWGSFLLGP